MGLFELLLAVATAAVAAVGAIFALLGRHHGRNDPKEQVEAHIHGAAIIDSSVAERWADAAEGLLAEAKKQTDIHDGHAKAMQEAVNMMKQRDQDASRKRIDDLERTVERLRNSGVQVQP